MELYDRAYQIQSLFDGRNLFQYLLAGGNTVLIDTGIAETPEKVIFPYMERLGLAPDKLTFAVTTHADLDHQGGNDAIKVASPRTLLSCGEADDWALEVLHVPGHSHGHLALYDSKHKSAFVGDAVHGRGCPKATGGMAIPVTYYYVDTYLSTLRYLESLEIETLYSGHWPIMTGDEIRDFISDSRQTVEIFDRTILSSLGKRTSGLTMKELIDAVSNAVGDWPKETWSLAMFSVNGHMDRLRQLGKVRVIRGAWPVKWELA
jgi:glyoxylase-like metal-dependent hydrolase (beta-lactamase superfamily II)